MKSILVTGFSSFQGESLNPSEGLIENIKADYKTLVLPVSYEKSWTALSSYLVGDPDIKFLVALGQAGGRPKVSLERIAVNLMDSETADEDGQVLTSQKILDGGPEAFISKLPLRDWVHASSGRLEISNSAGLFVCNSVYYHAQEFLRARGGEALFVHLPYQVEQLTSQKTPGTPALAIADMEASVRFILGLLAER